MPIPSPREGETENEFVGRCMSALSDEDRPNDQKVAICYSKWREKGKKAAPVALGVDVRRVFQVPVRAVEGHDDRVLSYAAIWGDADHRDLYDTWFTKDTDFALDWYDKRPWIYDHGFNRFVRAAKVGEWKDTGIDDKGLFFLGELDDHFRYLDEVQFLLDIGYLFPSSGTMSHLMSIASDGWIERWPVSELSSTTAPAEWRIPPQLSASARSKAAQAIRTLLGGLTMSDNVAGALFPGVSLDPSTEPARSADEEPVVEAEDEELVEEPIEPVPGEVLETETAEPSFDEQTQRAIVAIDETLREVAEQLRALREENDQLRDRVEELEAEEPSQVAQLAHLVDQRHWTDRLFSVTRSGRVLRGQDVEEGGGDEPLDPAHALFASLGSQVDDAPASGDIIGAILSSQR